MYENPGHYLDFCAKWGYDGRNNVLEVINEKIKEQNEDLLGHTFVNFVVRSWLFFLLPKLINGDAEENQDGILRIFPILSSCGNCTREEAKICYKSPEIRSGKYYKVTKRGVCVADYVCKYFEGCESAHDGNSDWVVLKGESKEKFRIEEINAGLTEPAYIIYSFKGDFFWWPTKGNGRFQKVDGASFKYLGGQYYKDKDNIYYGNGVVEEADYKSFKYVIGQWAQDDKNIYRNGNVTDEMLEYGAVATCFYDEDPTDLIEVVNRERRTFGIGELRLDQDLEFAANKTVKDMNERGYFSTVTPENQELKFFLDENAYKYRNVGVNLAKNAKDSIQAVEEWMEENETRDNILDPNYQDVGIAILDGIENGGKSSDCLVVVFFGEKRQY